VKLVLNERQLAVRIFGYGVFSSKFVMMHLHEIQWTEDRTPVHLQTFITALNREK